MPRLNVGAFPLLDFLHILCDNYTQIRTCLETSTNLKPMTQEYTKAHGIFQIVSFVLGAIALLSMVFTLLGLGWVLSIPLGTITTIAVMYWQKWIVEVGPTNRALFKNFGKWFNRQYGPGYYLNIPYFHELSENVDVQIRRTIKVEGEFSCFGVITYKKDKDGNTILERVVERETGTETLSLLIVDRKSPIPMKVSVNLQYEIINLEKYIKAGGEAEVKKVFESIASDAIRGYAAMKKPEDLIKMGTTQLVERIEKAIRNLPGELHDRMELSEFGILVIHKTISTETIEFKNKDAERDYEKLSREDKQASAEKREMEHLLEIATMLVKESGGTMSFENAVVAAQINMGKNGVDHIHYSGVENARMIIAAKKTDDVEEHPDN